jgi:hypothetical protein
MIKMLLELANWIEYEYENGNRVKASKLYKMFLKYGKIKFPKENERFLKQLYFADPFIK